jgi:hypothetical protein
VLPAQVDAVGIFSYSADTPLPVLRPYPAIRAATTASADRRQ